MKRARIVFVIAVAILAAWWIIPGPKPAFVPADEMEPIGAYTTLTYDSRNPAPLLDGLIWLNTGGTNQSRWFLCDVNKREVLGELLRGEPMFMKGDRLVCAQRAEVGSGQRFGSLLYYVTNGRIRFGISMVDKFWIVNIKRGSPKRLGECQTARPSYSNFHPSPDFRFAYNNSGGTQLLFTYFCDVDTQKLWGAMLQEWPGAHTAQGWWSATEVIFRDTKFNYVLYDVLSRKASLFLSGADRTNAFAKANLPVENAMADILQPVWNGRDYDFYLISTYNYWARNGSYLFKVERPDRALTLVSTNFKFHFHGEWNMERTQYIYSGGKSWNASGVYLRDLRDGSTRTLMEPERGQEYISLPKFHAEGVIYIHQRALWWMDLNSSNAVQIFPPTRYREEGGVLPSGERKRALAEKAKARA